MDESISASKCPLFIPGHFIMGWFVSFMKDFPPSSSLRCPIQSAPFVIDSVRREPMSLVAAHNLFWEFDETGTSLRSLDFLGRSMVRFPRSGGAIHLWDDHSQYRGPRALSIAAVDLLMSSCVGGVLHRCGERYDNQVYCPHRFARMFNRDQHVPELDMLAGDEKTNRLDFRSYLTNSREESLELLGRRHLCFHRLEGHTFYVQPVRRIPGRTMDYIDWHNKAFAFLQAPELFCVPCACTRGRCPQVETAYYQPPGCKILIDN